MTDSEVAFRPRRQLVVTVDDGSDTCVLRFFSFYPSQQKALAVGDAHARARRAARAASSGWQMVHPTVAAAGGELPEALTPVYSTVAGLPQAYLRKAVLSGLARADLSRDGAARRHRSAWQPRHGPCARRCSSCTTRRPTSRWPTLEDRSHPAWQRLKAEELLAQQLSQLQSKRERDAAARAGAARRSPAACTSSCCAVLPFALTGAQHRVGEEIARDLARAVPMHRLLQGDVGSGKTVVAALAAAIAIDAGWQCALMAPTEILAEQHFRKLVGWLEPLLAPRGLRGGLAHRQPEEEGARRDAGSGSRAARPRWWSARMR